MCTLGKAVRASIKRGSSICQRTSFRFVKTQREISAPVYSAERKSITSRGESMNATNREIVPNPPTSAGPNPAEVSQDGLGLLEQTQGAPQPELGGEAERAIKSS